MNQVEAVRRLAEFFKVAGECGPDDTTPYRLAKELEHLLVRHADDEAKGKRKFLAEAERERLTSQVVHFGQRGDDIDHANFERAEAIDEYAASASAGWRP